MRHPGMNVNTAMSVIARERPDVEYICVPEGSMVTMDYWPLRVRLWIGRDDAISQVPRCG